MIVQGLVIRIEFQPDKSIKVYLELGDEPNESGKASSISDMAS